MYNMDDMKKLFGKKIKELRQKNHLTQEQLAELLNLDRKSISNIECGRTFPANSLDRMTQIFNVDNKTLFDFKYSNDNKEIHKRISQKLKKMTVEQLEVFEKLLNLI